MLNISFYAVDFNSKTSKRFATTKSDGISGSSGEFSLANWGRKTLLASHFVTLCKEITRKGAQFVIIVKRIKKV